MPGELPGLRDSLSQIADEPRASRQALLEPPKDPQKCLFSKMSTNLLGRPDHPSRTLHFWRDAGLQPVRLRGFQPDCITCSNERFWGR